MDYFKHYNLLIDRAKTRSISGYSEKHHVVPKCMGGTDDCSNLVNLTAEEHYLAHLLLVKMYPNSHKLSYAAIKMTVASSGQKRTNNKRYAWLKKEHSIRYSLNETGKEYYNNGIKNIKLKPGEPVPEGFVKGRSYSPTKGTSHNRKTDTFKSPVLQKELANRRWAKERLKLCELFNLEKFEDVISLTKTFKESHGRYWLTPYLNKYPFMTKVKARHLITLSSSPS